MHVYILSGLKVLNNYNASYWQGDEFKPNQVTEYGEWNNDMADGMMPLQEEKAAFEDDDGKA